MGCSGILTYPQAQVYGSSPFPTKPSQILSPREYKEQGSTFGPEVDVSHQSVLVEI